MSSGCRGLNDRPWDRRVRLATSVRRVMPVAAGLLAALALATFSGSASAGRDGASTWTAHFTDAVGDGGAAPDLLTVEFTGDAAAKTVTFQVAAKGALPSADALERVVSVWIDADKNRSTGDPADGTEYLLQFWTDPAEPDGWAWFVGRWENGDWHSIDSSAVSFGGLANMSWTVSAADLGGATSFAAYVVADTEDAAGAVMGRDVAPDSGEYLFDMAGPTLTETTFVKPVIGNAATVPATPVAGRRLSVSFPVRAAGDQTKPLANGTMTSDVSMAGKVVPRTASLRRGIARLSFVVPANARGKQLKVKVTVKAASHEDEPSTYATFPSGYQGIQTHVYTGMSTTKVVTLRVR